MIGVRGVVREKLEKQETLEKGGGGSADLPNAVPAKRRKLSKSDSVESTVSDSSRRSTLTAKQEDLVSSPVAKRKLAKSDSLDSNVSSTGSSTDSRSMWTEEDDVRVAMSKRQLKRNVSAACSANARKRQKLGGCVAKLNSSADPQAAVLPNIALRFQYDFEANNDSDYDPKTVGDEEEDKSSSYEKLEARHIEALLGMTDLATSPDGRTKGEAFVNKPTVTDIVKPPNSIVDLPYPSQDDEGGEANKIASPPCDKKKVGLLTDGQVESVVSEKESPICQEAGSRMVESSSSSGQLTRDDKLPLSEAVVVNGGDNEEDEEDLNSSRDSEDVWAAFRIKDEIELEDNTEIWANTMDIFKSIEDMFTNNDTSSKEEEEKCDITHPSGKRTPGVHVVDAAAPSGECAVQLPETRRDSVTDDNLSSGGENPDSSKENNGGETMTVSKRKKFHGGTSGGGKSTTSGAIPAMASTERKNRDPKTVAVAGSNTYRAEQLLARKTGSLTASSSDGGFGAALAATGLATTPPKQMMTSNRTPMVKLIEPSPLDPERLERLPPKANKNNSGNSSRPAVVAAAAAAGSRSPANSRRHSGGNSKSVGSNGASRPEPVGKKTSNSKNPSSKSNQDKLLNFLDREYERELSRSKQPRK